ncbi:MAG: LacI family DNA-binding transcriptional regulator [Oscillospiraceae bacterium]|nr:LacI family DNA-binding transcriptional regulator [Oscillospiraceae bacterium]
MNIDEIARLAGVSKSTVSRVLNNKADVSKKTFDRITEVINDTGYTPNAFAKAINEKKAKTIGLIIPHDADYFFSNLYYTEFLHGVSVLIDEQSYYLTLFYPKFNDYILAFKQKRIDGFIVAIPAHGHEKMINSLVNVGAPLVLTGRPPARFKDLPYVDVDDFRGAKLAMTHLIGLGHKRIAFVGEENLISSGCRLDAYRECLRVSGLVCDEALIRLASDNPLKAGSEIMRELMTLPNPPTAVFFSSDMLAISASSAVYGMGLRIPEDVSLVGYDGIIMSKYQHPPLTTVYQPAFDKGHTIAQILVDYLRDGTPMKSLCLDTPLLVRGSTGPPPNRDLPSSP